MRVRVLAEQKAFQETARKFVQDGTVATRPCTCACCRRATLQETEERVRSLRLRINPDINR